MDGRTDMGDYIGPPWVNPGSNITNALLTNSITSLAFLGFVFHELLA